MRAAGILDVDIDADGAREIARRSRGTPRIANRLLRRVRDFAEVRGDGAIDRGRARPGLALFGVDELGLDKVDRAILAASASGSAAGRSGCRRWPSASSEQTETVEDVYEPFLIQQGLLMRTPRGRVATPAAWQHLGLSRRPSAAAVAARPVRPEWLEVDVQVPAGPTKRLGVKFARRTWAGGARSHLGATAAEAIVVGR